MVSTIFKVSGLPIGLEVGCDQPVSTRRPLSPPRTERPTGVRGEWVGDDPW